MQQLELVQNHEHYMFALEDRAELGIQNIRSLHLAVVELMTVQVTKLSLWRKIREIGMLCVAKPVLTEDLYTVKKFQ
jgi:hypothetical protein